MRARAPREVEVTIENLDGDGLGSARLEERSVRIRNALPGEQVAARVLKRRRGEWLGEAFRIQEPVPGRVSPPCEHFPRCGGCVLQHLEYSQQLALKQSTLLGELGRHRIEPRQVRQPSWGPRLHYRTKARLGVRVVGGAVLVGFRESFSNRVARLTTCLTLVPEFATLLVPLQALIAQLSRPERVPQVELAAGDTDRALVLRHLEPLTGTDRDLIARFARTHDVRCYSQSGGYETVERIGPGGASGTGDLLGYANPDYGLHFLFAPTDFTQVNLGMNRKLVRAAVAALDAPAGSRVLDLFCGIGNFSLALATTGLNVRGVELSAQSIARAEQNAQHNALADRCEFVVGDLYDPACRVGDADYVLLDPPRSGAGPNLAQWLSNSRVKRIVYVSCSPESFARDARVLADAGFDLTEAGIFDMFPQTSHVETLGVFQRPW